MDDLEPDYEYSDTGFPVNRPIQFFALAFRSPSVVRLINIDQHIASCVQEKIEQLLPLEKSGYVCFSDYHTGFTGRFNIYDLVLEKPFFKGETSVVKGGRNINSRCSLSCAWCPLLYWVRRCGVE